MGFPEGLKPPSREARERSKEVSRSMFPDGSSPDVITPHDIDAGITREVAGFDLSTGEVVIYELGGGPVVESLEEVDEVAQDPRVQRIIAESMRDHTD